MDMYPKSVGIIMDGNRRWAKAKGMAVFQGHENGYQTLRDFLDWSKEVGINNIIAFAFSTENWQRSKDEVSFLLDLIRKVLKDGMQELMEKKVRVRFAGDISKFPDDIKEGMQDVEKASEKNTDFNLVLCVSYGGREEIIHAYNELLKQGKKEVTDTDISNNLYTKDFPDPDMIIRTSGEMRLSGFLPWQGVYSELFFTKTLWPDFSKEEYLSMLEEYKMRERRRGK